MGGMSAVRNGASLASAVGVGQAATTRSSRDGGHAAAASAALSPGQSAPNAPKASPAAMSAFEATKQAVTFAHVAADAADTATRTARIAKTAAYKAVGVLQAMSSELHHVPLAELGAFLQPMAAAASQGAVNGSRSWDLMTQASAGPTSGLPPISAIPAAQWPFPPPPDLAAMAAVATGDHEQLPQPPGSDALGSSRHDAATAHTQPAGAAALPSLRTRQIEPQTAGQLGTEQQISSTIVSPHTPVAAVRSVGMMSRLPNAHQVWELSTQAGLSNAQPLVLLEMWPLKNWQPLRDTLLLQKRLVRWMSHPLWRRLHCWRQWLCKQVPMLQRRHSQLYKPSQQYRYLCRAARGHAHLE